MRRSAGALYAGPEGWNLVAIVVVGQRVSLLSSTAVCNDVNDFCTLFSIVELRILLTGASTTVASWQLKRAR